MPRNKSWFRFYSRMIDSPQVLELNDSEFRLLVSLWCLASEADNSGRLEYSIPALKRRIMPDKSEEEIRQMLEHLMHVDLLAGEEGNYEIPRWEQHQYEYPSRIPANRSDYKKQSESNRKENGKIDTDTDTEYNNTPPKSPPTPSADEQPQAGLSRLLSRYTQEQQEVINRYWEVIRFTRKSARVADSVKLRELEYWDRYPPDVVIEALDIHLSRYPTKQEDYTRGIIRRIMRERELSHENEQKTEQKQEPELNLIQFDPKVLALVRERYKRARERGEQMRKQMREQAGLSLGDAVQPGSGEGSPGDTDVGHFP